MLTRLVPAEIRLRTQGWCGRGDLNPQGFLHSILSAARLPISPRPRMCGFYINTSFFQVFLLLMHAKQFRSNALVFVVESEQ